MNGTNHLLVYADDNLSENINAIKIQMVSVASKTCVGRDTAQLITRRLFVAEARVRAQVSPCDPYSPIYDMGDVQRVH